MTVELQLGEVVQFQGGGTPKREEPAYWGGSIPWASVKDIKGSVLEKTIESITEAGVESSATRIVPAGSVIMATRMGLGKVCMNTIPVAINQDLKALTPDRGRLVPKYLLYFLLSKADMLEGSGTGATVKGVAVAELQRLCLPVPPLPDQERIVQLLDAAEVLRRLRAEADRRTADLIPAIFNEMFGGSDKSQHPVRRLAEIAEVVSGVAKGRRFNGQRAVIVPYIRVANVQAGWFDLAEIKTIEALPDEVKELALKHGDVLLTEGGDFDKLGRGAMWEADIPNCIHQNHVFRVRPDNSLLLPAYFTKFLQTQEARLYFLRCAKKTTNLASINMTQLRALPVPVPPLPLQKAFVARAAEVNELEAQQAASRRRLDELFQSMLHRAFTGELTATEHIELRKLTATRGR